MDILSNYETLLFLITGFLIFAVVLPFIIGEIRKNRRSRELKNRIIKVETLTEEDLKKIRTENPEGKRVYPAINQSICVGCASCVMSCNNKKALYIVGNKSTLVNPFECTSRGDCEKQCPTGALQLVEYGKKLKIKLPEIDENFQSNVKGIYIIGSLNGSGLIKEAINQGRAVINDIMKDVFPDNLPRIVIAGAGPGGLSTLLSAKKFGLEAECLEKDLTANTIKNFPKKKILMAEPVDIPIYGPLWIGDTSREELLKIWDKILFKTGVQVRTGYTVEAIEKVNGSFKVTASGKAFYCDKVILAVGNRGIPRKLNVPGEEGSNVFYTLLDAAEFANKKITIVGAGDSAIEAALSLENQGCEVKIVVRGAGFPKAKSKNRDKILEKISEKRIIPFYESNIRSISNKSITINVMGESHEISNDYVFIMAGGVLPYKLLEKTGVNIIEKEL